MFRLRDFFPVRPADDVLQDIVACGPGLVVVAGPEGRAYSPAAEHPGNTAQHNLNSTTNQGGTGIIPAGPSGLLPSGRAMIFRALVEEILETDPNGTAILVTHIPLHSRAGRGSWRRIKELVVDESHTYADRMLEAAERNPMLLLVDRLDRISAVAALEIARRGLRVIAQLDAPLRGRGVYRQLVELGATADLMEGLTWVLSIQRLPTLCQECRRAVLPGAADMQYLDRLLQLLEASGAILEAPPDDSPMISEAPGCAKCQYTGRQGDTAVVDISQMKVSGLVTRLPMEACLWRQVQHGMLSLRDLLYFDQDLLQRTFNLLASTEYALVDVQGALERSRSELQSVSRVLEHRNQALFSFQDIGDALIRFDNLYDLADRVCRRANDLCAADRAILYYLRQDEQVEVAAVIGWEGAQVHQRVDPALVFRPRQGDMAQTFRSIPAGVHEPGLGSAKQGVKDLLPAGLFVPLVAQGERVGAMVIQSTHKDKFSPGEIAMLQTFANQAALALQRAGLVEDLRHKIAELEAAQAGLAEKERMQREMELARQVQQSVLPRSLPEVPGFSFSARSEAARQVGGDFYDVIDLDDAHFALAIADVSDKGMPAAMYMVLTRSLMVAQARRETSPAQVLREVNDLLQHLSTAGMFVTVFYAVVNKLNGEMRYARAGHDMPILLRQGSGEELGGRGIALGVLGQDEFYIDEHQITLQPGDRLVLYTDGLTDVMTPEQELFGRERLFHLLADCAANSPGEICQSVFTALRNYQNGADQFDDMTLLVVEMTGN